MAPVVPLVDNQSLGPSSNVLSFFFFFFKSFKILSVHVVYMGVVHTHGGKNTRGVLFLCLYGNICYNNFFAYNGRKDGVSGWVYTTRDGDENASSLFIWRVYISRMLFLVDSKRCLLFLLHS